MALETCAVGMSGRVEEKKEKRVVTYTGNMMSMGQPKFLISMSLIHTDKRTY